MSGGEGNQQHFSPGQINISDMIELKNQDGATDSVAIQVDNKPDPSKLLDHHEGVGEEAMEAVRKLGILDKYLSVWILLACGLGLGLGQINAVIDVIGKTSVGTTNIFVAIGLIFMILPPLAKVKWNTLHLVFGNTRLLGLTLFLNWVLGPLLMFALSIIFFGKKGTGLMSGLSLVGCARCIAMVLVWNQLAGGDNQYCAAIVALNSILTIALYSPYAVLFVMTLPQALLHTSVKSLNVTIADVAESVAVYLGIPFVLGILLWFSLTRKYGDDWYFNTFSPRLGKLTLFSLLFTVVILFASQSKSIFHQIGSVLYAILPLALYFLLMFVGSFYASFSLGATYPQCVTLAFTAASNNFELALAVAVSTFGLHSDEALMSVVGALIEIPTMLSLIYLAFYFKAKLPWKKEEVVLAQEEKQQQEA